MLFVDHIGGWLFASLIGAAATVGTFEFYIMMRGGGYRSATALGLPAAVTLAVLPFLAPSPQPAWTAALVLLMATSGTWYLVPTMYKNGLGGWLTTVAGAMYVGLFLGHLSLLRLTREGVWWVFAVLIVTWAYDTGAYFAGSFFGRHPFMQHVSSKKTIEGVAGGLALSSLAALLAVPTVGLRWWQALAFGLASGAVVQAGDLVESMMKRHVGVKDSGAIVPGHGGLLDRIDGLLFSGALAYYAAVLFGYAS